MDNWKSIGIREKMQIINGSVLVIAAIVLYFLAFIMTLTVGLEVVSAGATMLATGLAFFGITGYIKNQMLNFETKVEKRMRQIEEEEEIRKEENEGQSDS